MVEPTKYCGGCDRNLSLNKFGKNKAKKDGLATQCKSCCKRYRDENKTRLDEYRQSYKELNRERAREYAKERWRTHGRDYQYGLPPGTISMMLEEQNGKCANPGCSKEINWETSNVDHDHSCCESSRSCGKCVRGLLCAGCNWALGNVEDSADALVGLVTYLRRGLVI